MAFQSQIAFTLDTVCPWTYLAKRRLEEALRQFYAAHPDAPVQYTIKYFPFQLNPQASQGGEPLDEYFRKKRPDMSPERMKMMRTIMTEYGRDCGINFKFEGQIAANTLNAHRLIQHYQKEKGPEIADKIILSLYTQYFENAQHPSSPATLLKAATDAGIPADEAEAFVADESIGQREVKLLIRQQAGAGIDGVPYIVIEGKKRDFATTGAREVGEYARILEQVLREAE
ncbi:thioredoxin-like protein [Trichodelitschia bisporula]|uniref:Thioredoxin-like protein n=1 Tax=Trichodelitschia bisporula TaxID=703511 RepID=A0A6G1HNY1_9PEZI|nr:thioredoxin-like protein [Trichodelitschia bisporula]